MIARVMCVFVSMRRDVALVLKTSLMWKWTTRRRVSVQTQTASEVRSGRMLRSAGSAD